MPKVLSLIPYKIFPAKLGGQKGIALFNQYLAKLVPLTAYTVKTNLPEFADYQVMNNMATGASRYANPRQFYTLRNIIQKQGFTHLILEHPYFGWLGMLLKRSTGIKLAVHSHNIESTRWKTLGKWWWRILWNYERLLHRKADCNFFIHDDDRAFAIREYGVDPAKCITVTYGIEWQKAPSAEERNAARTELLNKYDLGEDTSILLFNGSLNYAPNLHALQDILDKINPLIFEKRRDYRIIICGSGLPAEFEELKNYSGANIIYAGFVDDIGLYFLGADIFINPVIEGGGIKTKLVEAVGMGARAVSTNNGSIGVDKSDCGEMLEVVLDADWQGFAQATLRLMDMPPATVPDAFFEKFYWGNIAAKAAKFLLA